MSRVVVALASQCAITLGLAVPLLHHYGITGVGIAWFLGQLAVAVPIVLTRRSAFWPRRDRTMRRLRRGPDLTVDAVAPRNGSAGAIVKRARGTLAAQQLAREHAVLRELHAMEKLGDWRRLLPRPLEAGDVGPHSYLAVTVLPGIEASRLLRDRGDVRSTATAAAAIAPLARATAEFAAVADEQLSRWVAEPAAVIAANARIVAQPRLGHALRRLEDELCRALAGRRPAGAWAHGDYWLGNLLVSTDGDQPTGIVDWERSAPGDLAVLDTVHLLVTTRALVRRRELGAIVRELAAGGRWSADEERLLAALREDLGDDDVQARHLVLLAWLRHVSNNLSKRAAYATHRRWLRNNVVAVLESVDA
jgi:aminoglycoside phosphotransferase (APT) family kinase protein